MMQIWKLFDSPFVFNAVVCWTFISNMQVGAFLFLGLSATFHQAILLSIVITCTTIVWSHLQIGGSAFRK